MAKEGDEIFNPQAIRDLGLEYENKVVKSLNKTGYMRNYLCGISRKFCSQGMSGKDSFLEIGFGLGGVLKEMILKGAKNIVGVDSEPKHVELASLLLKEVLSQHPEVNLSLICDSLPRLTKLEGRYFRSILCAATLPHLRPFEFMPAIRKLHELLEPGGTIYITTSSPYNKVYKGLAQEYERRLKTKDKFPGYIEKIKEYHPEGIGHNLGFLLFFDPQVLAERFKEAGFKVLEADYVDIAENKRSVTGLIAVT